MKRAMLLLIGLLISHPLYAQEGSGPYSISGTVTFEGTNEPIKNTDILALDASTEQIVSGATTKSDGTYKIQGLDVGEYKLFANGTFYDYPYTYHRYEPEYYQDKRDFDSATTVTVNRDVTGIDLVLSYGGGVSGRLTRSWDGQPIAFTNVFLLDSLNEFINRESTDIDGRFQITGEVKGRVGYVYADGVLGRHEQAREVYDPLYFPGVVDFSSAQRLVLDSVLTNIDLALSGVLVSGRVTRESNGNIIAGTEVLVLDQWGNPVKNTKTDGSGRYLIGALQPGAYYLCATGYINDGTSKPYLDEYWNEAATLEEATLLNLTIGEMENINFTLAGGASITGTVTRQDNGQPIANTEVAIFNEEWNHVSSATTRTDGAYGCGGLSPGFYYAAANGIAPPESGGDPMKRFKTEYYHEAATRDQATLFEVTDKTTGIDFTLEEGLTLSGTITNTGGATLHGPEVKVYDSTWQEIAKSGTGWYGEYTIGGLDVGAYYIEVIGVVYVGIEAQHLYADQYYPGVLNRSDAELYQLTQNSVLNFSLSKGRSLSGMLYNQDTGEIIAGAELSLWGQDGNPIQGDNHEIRTNAQGEFISEGLAPGSYILYASGLVDVPGEGWQPLFQPRFYQQANDWQEADPIDLSEENQTDLSFFLKPALAISGTVRQSSDQSPVANTRIELFDSSFNIIWGLDTDNQGHYTIQGLQPGSYYLQATGYINTPGGPVQQYVGQYYPGTTNRDDAQTIELTDASVSGIDFELQRGLSISGTVRRNADNSLIAEAHIELLDENFQRIDAARSNQLGEFRLAGLTQGAYYVYANGNVETQNGAEQQYIGQYYPGTTDREEAQPVQLTDASVSGIDFSLQKGLSISGTVRRQLDNSPIPRAKVSLLDSTFSHIWDAEADAQGNYRFESLVPASYYLRATGEVETQSGPDMQYIGEYYPGVTDQAEAQLIHLTDTDVTGIDFLLQQGLSISGNIYRQSDQSPIAGARISLLNENFDWITEQIANDQGQYRFAGLISGSYHVLATGEVETQSGPVMQFIGEYYPGVTDQEEAQLIQLTDQDSTGIDFVLQQGLSISGTVYRQSDQSPIPGARVNLLNENFDWLRDNIADDQGQFRFDGVTPGSYHVYATGEVETQTGPVRQYIEQYYPGTPNREEAQLIQLSESDVSEIDFHLSSGAMISGHITDNDGTSIAHMQVEAFDSTWNHVGQTSTDENGYYCVAGLTSGEYLIMATGRIAEGWQTVQLYRTTFYPRAHDFWTAEFVHVDSSAVADIQMLPSYAILGELKRSDNGNMIQDAQIFACDTQWRPLAEGGSNSDGYFSVVLPDTGYFYLKFTGNIWTNLGAYWDWDQLYHPCFYPGVFDSTQAETIHLTDRVDGIRMYLRDINIAVEQARTAPTPEIYALAQNFPNPFNPGTLIQYQLPGDARVELSIFDVQGREIRNLVHGNQSAGFHTAAWDGLDCRLQRAPSGIYLYRIVIEPKGVSGRRIVDTRKMLLLK
ncbi:MAG: carboxypeptidase regulatory-like domain-containing protein [candidate division KSB1 bacterium]|nr:carboxypeptidase regulatory-like domain-containing protein [candidate division KSB1 bacterium]